jgi:YD repeat-containing protein
MLTPAQAWVLNTYTSETIMESSVSRTSLFCFDRTTGFLERVRRLQGIAPLTADTITRFSHGSTGNVIGTEWFGGDTQSVQTDPLCGSGISSLAATYSMAHSYEAGSLKTSQYGGVPFLSTDNTIDLPTGLVRIAEDSAGRATTMTYDTSGRITNSTAPGEAPTSFAHTNAILSGGSLVPAAASISANSSQGRGTFGHIYQYDAFGRLWREKRLMPDDTWSVTETLYDALGRKKSVSEWSPMPVPEFTAVPNRTQFTYDALNRVTLKTAPDGSNTQFNYNGGVSMTRSEQYGAGNTSKSTTENYDRFGRLSSITEAVGTPLAATTNYDYDSAGRVTKVTMARTETTQIRTFEYDGRGFLTAETHPELGLAGNGETSYEYDARGHVRRKTIGTADGPFDHGYDYDAAERLIRVRTRDAAIPSAFRTMKEFGFLRAGIDDGRLVTATRHNYRPLLPPANGEDVIVTETYEYGVQGRVSAKTTLVATPQMSQAIQQEYTYNDLGLAETLTYPYCVGPTGCTAPPSTLPNPIQMQSRNASIIGVQGFTAAGTDGITFHANGAVNAVRHANGTIDTYEADPHGIARPQSISFQSLSECQGPGVITPPASQSVPYGQSRTLTVDASGSTPLWFQWYLGSTGNTSSPIIGATTASYITGSITQTTQYWVLISNSCGQAMTATANVTVALETPGNLLATSSGSQVTVSWVATQPAHHFEIERRANGSTTYATASASPYVDAAVPGTAYVYRVRSVDAGGDTSTFSNGDIATAMTFTPVEAGTWIDNEQFEELLAALNAVRAVHAGPGASWTWSDLLPPGTPAPADGAIIDDEHILSLRSRMESEMNLLGLTAWTYTDPTLAGLEVKALHLIELQERTR